MKLLLLVIVVLACAFEAYGSVCLPSDKKVNCANKCPIRSIRWPEDGRRGVPPMCYKYFPKKLNFAEANKFCAGLTSKTCSRGSWRNDLVAISGQEENDNAVLAAYKAACIKPGGGFWIGLKRYRRSWRWEEPSSRRYQDWNGFIASNRNGRGNDCAKMNPNGQWESADCDEKLPFICRGIPFNRH